MRVNVRNWKDNKPTKTGISLTLMQCKNRVHYNDYLYQASTDKKTTRVTSEGMYIAPPLRVWLLWTLGNIESNMKRWCLWKKDFA